MHVNNGISFTPNSRFAPQEVERKSTPKVKAKKSKAQNPVDVAEIKTPDKVKATSGKVEKAKEIPGLFRVVQKDGRTHIAVKPDQLNKPFFFSSNVSKGVGERGLVGSEMGRSYLAEFRQVDDRVQLVALHTENFAESGTPQSKFVSENYSDSLLSSATYTTEADKELLVDAEALLFGDIAGYQARLARAYPGTKFQADPNNTTFRQVDNSPEQTSFAVQTHYLAPVGSAGPSTTPLANSVLTEFRYNFLQLPEDPMTPRLADERIGHFVTTRKDYTGDEGDGKLRFVNRWRLEKKDPDAPMSAPVKPITYWIANDVPEEYREAVKDGILEWNKAFERIGFQNAIEVRQQKVEDTFDTLDARHASVRWYTAADVGSAVGPSHVDPRTGEILDADIRMADLFGRSAKSFLVQNPPKPTEQSFQAVEHGHLHDHHGHDHTCSYAEHAAVEQQFATGLLQTRGDTEASKALAQAYVKDVVMHEVGHTLGLRHNFKGSTVYSPEQLQDPEFTRRNGLGSTVMDYHPFNLAGEGEKQGEYVSSTLGAYDYLAIQYAYQPLDPAQEKEALNAIARKTTTDPLYAFETDEAADDMDPEVTRFDLGQNPLEFAGKQMGLARELWTRAQNQELPQDASYKELTKAFTAGLSKVASAARLATRHIGGVNLRRDRAGTGNPIYSPVPAAKQREALGLVLDTMFTPESFKFKPEFVSRLAKERFGVWGDQNLRVGEIVLATQKTALQGLLDDRIAQRVIDNPEKLPEGSDTFKLSELYQGLKSKVWTELEGKSEISQPRRNLQKAYLEVVSGKLGSESQTPAEAKSLIRYLARQLQSEISESLTGGMSLEQRAHLEDCQQTLKKTLEDRVA